MRVRITSALPLSYGANGASLRIGSVYDLESSLASALIVDQCAELYDALSDEEKHRASTGTGFIWEASDRARRSRL
ncbi:MAG: hypothetical protein AB7P99_02495 [Vicinamibacterales bacterium]